MAEHGDQEPFRRGQPGSTDTDASSIGLGFSGVDCREAVHQLYHYLDGELTESNRQRIAQHLDFCGPCSGAAEFEAELRQVIACKCRDRVPEALRARIARAIDEESRHQHGVAGNG